MGRRSRRQRVHSQQRDEAPRDPTRTRAWLFAAAIALATLAVGFVLAVRRAPAPVATPPSATFTRVGQNGPVLTVSVPRSKVDDDAYLMRIAEQLSSEQLMAGGSGQISVMIWPDDVPVPKDPPTTEFDASMKTQAAGIFINPAMNIKHFIRFRNGATVAEKDYGRPTR